MFPRALRREVIALLLFKALALFVIYQMFFAPLPEPGGRATLIHLVSMSGH
jgi:hypothetical protein